MARIREKTLKFPGLDNVYTFADEADLFDANVDCAVGEYRIYNGDLYCCTTPHTGAWDASHFKAVKMGNEVSVLNAAFAYYSGNLIDSYSVVSNMYIDASTKRFRIGANPDRLICIEGKPNTTYIFKKQTATVVRIGCTDTNSPENNSTVARNYITNGTASGDELIFTTDSGKYIFIQLFVDGDNSSYKTIDANLKGAMLYESVLTDIEDIDNLLLIEKPAYTLDSGKYINATTNEISSNSSFSLLNPISVKKHQTVFLKTAGYSNTTGIIALCNENNTERRTVVASYDGTTRVYKYTVEEDGYITGTISNSVECTLFLGISVPEVLSIPTVQYPQMFNKVVCIGDSITLGNKGDGTSYTKNYPFFFGKLAQAETAIKAIGGYSAKEIWDSLIASATDLAEYDCAIIYLGTNDGLTDTVSTDCNAEDYTQNTDNDTGCYGKIVGKIKADAPNCKIFCVAGANEYVRRATTMNPAVRDIAALYDVGLIDIENSILSDNGNAQSPERKKYRPYDGTHYSVYGYCTLANVIYDTMNNYIKQHPDKYVE